MAPTKATTDGLPRPSPAAVEAGAGDGAGDQQDQEQEQGQEKAQRPPYHDGAKDGPRPVSLAESLPLWREVLFVAVVCLGQVFTQAGLGGVMPLTGEVGASFGVAAVGERAWYASGYSLTVGTFILFSGRLGDAYGCRTVFLIGLGWFAVWSLACGLAVYAGHVFFVLARVLQGIGAALCLPNGIAMLGAAYAPGRRKGFAFAAYGGVAPAGAMVGAAFSSLLALEWWPWAMWTFAMVLAASVVLAHYVIPPFPAPPRRHEPVPLSLMGLVRDLDVVGAVLGVTGLVLVNVGWNQAPLVGWQRPYVGLCLGLGLVLFVAFLVWEVRWARRPLIPLEALTAEVSLVLAAVACGWSCFGIWLWYSWQFLLEQRHGSPLLVVAWMSPVVVSGALAALCVGVLLHRVGPPLVMTSALLAFSAGTVLMATAPPRQTYWANTLVSMLVTPWGMDMTFPAATIILSDMVASEHQGIAASLVVTVVNYSIALGLGFAGTVESQVNGGAVTADDQLRGFRAALYMGVGLAGLGVCVCVVFVVKTELKKRRANERVCVTA